MQNKEVIFLHWFHHVTVLLYCWHAFISDTATGLWCAAAPATARTLPRRARSACLDVPCEPPAGPPAVRACLSSVCP